MELDSLSDFVNDEILELSDDAIRITPLGKIFVRHVCTVFDVYFTMTQDSKYVPAIQRSGTSKYIKSSNG